MVAQVIVDIAHAGAGDSYDYAVPEEFEVSPGSRILVPFGRMTKQGIVSSLAQDTSVPAEKLRPILKVLDPYPALSADDLDLARYLSHTYHMPPAQSVRMLLPAKLRSGTDQEKTISLVQLALDEDRWDEAVSSLMKADGTPRYPKQIEVLEKLREEPYGIPPSELPGSTVKTLRKKGFVLLTQRTVEQQVPDVPPPLPPVVLEPQQEEAVRTILSSQNRRFLLHGVTGSGKTEVYIRVVLEALAKEKGAIILVPEIALTPQVYTYLMSRLGVPVALFHSKLTDAERFEQWKLVRSGKVRVVLGPRSAVFAPVSDLGVVIIDEEQETSYKSGRYPAYTAKEIALVRTEKSGGTLVLGSATPSMETYKEALDGKWKLISMPNRIFGAKLPPVEVIDMRKEAQAGNPGIISAELDDAIRGALASGMQTMILLNRRGYSSFLMCTACGTALGCESCDVSMTYHKSEGMLKCHYCGSRKPVPDVCPECGSPHLQRVGIGTQKLEEQLHAMYPAARILRMDADTMNSRHAHEEAYRSFQDGEADILIGTQMIAKGFDFARVSVAAVLSADGMLHHPDYRSAERTFAQITQLAGRAGRRTGGHVYVQTYSPEHYSIVHAAKHDYEGFFREESAYRRGLFLPPYGEHVIVRFTSPNESHARAAAKDFFGRMRTALAEHKDDIIKARASESPIKRIDDQYRYQILVHLRKRDPAVEDIMYELLAASSYKNVLAGIDVNPNELY